MCELRLQALRLRSRHRLSTRRSLSFRLEMRSAAALLDCTPASRSEKVGSSWCDELGRELGRPEPGRECGCGRSMNVGSS